jgi:hypothetical protein
VAAKGSAVSDLNNRPPRVINDMSFDRSILVAESKIP